MRKLLKRRKGKYLKDQENRKSNAGKCVPAWLPVSFVLLVLVLVAMLFCTGKHSIYQTLVDNGYTGTQEQWLASLVGEEADHTQTAYRIACSHGYRDTEAAWIKTLTGVKVNEVSKTPYVIACENGFQGTLAQWLTEIAEKPESLGKSDGTGQMTGYELACQYGYKGTFIEWLVSITQDNT